MSDLMNTNPPVEEELSPDGETNSPLAMLFTMVLLIAGFLLASALLLQQAFEARTADGERVFSQAALLEQLAAWNAAPATAAPQDTQDVQEQEPTPSALDGLRQLVERDASGQLRWPRLKLTGFGQSSDGSEEFAIINGETVYPGGYAGKVRLLEVRTHDVVVEYKGETRTLTVGQED